MMENILSQWDIEYKDIIEVQKNVWRIDESYYLKANNNQDWIKRINIFKELRANDIPTPDIVNTINGDNYLIHNNNVYYMTRKLKGRHLSEDEIINNPEAARSIGQVIAKLHKAFAIIMENNEFYDNNFINELNGWIRKNILEHVANSFTANILDDCINEMDLVYKNLNRQLIHRDLHLGNLLFDDYEITGYIDFDLTQINARIFDIAYLISGWIVDKVNDEDYISLWKQTVQFIIKGYQEVQELSEIEINSISTMMCCIEILFVAYFQRMNDYDNSLKAEECLKWIWNNRKTLMQV